MMNSKCTEVFAHGVIDVFDIEIEKIYENE